MRRTQPITKGKFFWQPKSNCYILSLHFLHFIFIYRVNTNYMKRLRGKYLIVAESVLNIAIFIYMSKTQALQWYGSEYGLQWRSPEGGPTTPGSGSGSAALILPALYYQEIGKGKENIWLNLREIDGPGVPMVLDGCSLCVAHVCGEVGNSARSRHLLTSTAVASAWNL